MTTFTYKYNDFDISYTENFLDEYECKELYNLLESHSWSTTRRASLLYGNSDVEYTVQYRGYNNTRHAIDWREITILQKILKKLEIKTEYKFDCVAIQYYHSGKIGIGAHRDKEIPEDGHIFGISLGATRTFRFNKKSVIHDLRLNHASLYHLTGITNKYWTHEIVTDDSIKESRFSLTFRVCGKK
jgi:alkylated DNA repair dioxygenase AlkB